MKLLGSKIVFSVVVPLRNEEQNVVLLHQGIIEALEKLNVRYEIIFVDDCSTDSTVENCRKLSPLTIIVLQKQSGQTAAMSAGISQASGEYIVTLDGDLQNDPADIPKLFNHLIKNNYDVVSGWRKKRQDSFSKKFISRGANLLRKFFLEDDIHDSGCSLKIYRRECFATLELYGEMHRFIPALLQMRGFSVGEVEVNHHPRKYGETKYGFSRTLKGFLDMVAIWFWRKFIGRPMHFLGGIGLLCWLLGAGFAMVAIWLKIFKGMDLSDTAFTVLSMFLFFFGLNFIFIGIMFDLSIKNYFSVSKEKPWMVKEVVRNN